MHRLPKVLDKYIVAEPEEEEGSGSDDNNDEPISPEPEKPLSFISSANKIISRRQGESTGPALQQVQVPGPIYVFNPGPTPHLELQGYPIHEIEIETENIDNGQIESGLEGGEDLKGTRGGAKKRRQKQGGQQTLTKRRRISKKVEEGSVSGEIVVVPPKPKSSDKRKRQRKKEIPVPVVCHLCGHLAKSRTSMYYHNMFVHLKSRNHVCTFCGKGFCQKMGLKAHLRIHTGEKPYECGTCGKTFTQSGSLKYHEVIHTGTKDFHCDRCNVYFSYRASLVRHNLRKHSEKPIQYFPCTEPDCGKVFRHAGFLRTHKKLVHLLGVSPKKSSPSSIHCLKLSRSKTSTVFYCDLCPEKFSVQVQLYKHDREIHSRFRPYACFRCPSRFTDPNEAKTHFLEVHGITVYPLADSNKESTNPVVDLGDGNKAETEIPSTESENKSQPVTGSNESQIMQCDQSSKSPNSKTVVATTPEIKVGIEKVGPNAYRKKVQIGDKIYYKNMSLVTKTGVIAEDSNSLPQPATPPKTKVMIIRKKKDSMTTNPSENSNFAYKVKVANVLDKAITVESSSRVTRSQRNRGVADEASDPTIQKPDYVPETITLSDEG